jgi:hypothetical protein
MGGLAEPTRAAKRFRAVVVVGCGALCVSVFLPWCKVWGVTYTFLDVDDWKALPMAELVIAGGGVVVAMIHLAWIKRIGLVVGLCALTINAVGMVVGARLADVHNTDPYFRIWAAISVLPQLGLWIALVACVALIMGALSGWPVSIAVRGTPPDRARPLHYVSATSNDVHGIPIQPHVDHD